MPQSTDQRRLAQIAAFKAEEKILRDLGLLRLNDVTRDKVEAYHRDVLKDLKSPDGKAAGFSRAWGMQLAAFAGILVLSAFFTAFVLRFWPSLPLAAQIAIGAGAPALTLGLTEMTHRAAREGVWLGGLLTLAAALIGLEGIAQTFNITLGMEMLVWGGALGWLMGHRYDSRILVFVGLFGLAGYVSSLIATFDGTLISHRLLVHQDGLVPAGVLIFLAGLIQARALDRLAAAYRLAGLAIAGLGLLGLSLPDISLFGERARLLYQIGAPVLAAVAIGAGIARNWGETRRAGVLLGFGWAAVRVMDWGRDLPRPALLAVLTALALATIWLSGLTRSAEARS